MSCYLALATVRPQSQYRDYVTQLFFKRLLMMLLVFTKFI